ncbi:hypothetical protein [Methylogaea oryzae]|uniref:hypothetical protein n=1 Tax=Methylogaea oryzae TaxID=1295382 RepID=UPI0006CFD515|nr:hypothetical protein [Methylogaea oryzae]
MSRRIAVLLVAQIAAAVASAGEVRTRGLAPLDNQSRGAARLQAIQDAERRAAELPGMRIMGNSRSDGLGTTQIQGDGRLGETRVVGESSNNGMLRVDTAVNVNPKGGCPAAHYRKKLAVAGFTLAHPDQALDLFDAGHGFAMELFRGLENNRRFQLRNAVSISVFPDPNLAPAVDTYGDPRAVAAWAARWTPNSSWPAPYST